MTPLAPLVNVLYGTVTGNAEEIATRIHAVLTEKGLQQGLLRCLSEYAEIPAFISEAERADVYNVIVVSTTGDGDPPETIRPFMKLLRSKDSSKLSQLHFAVLGLGDTNYENFCRTGKRIDAGLSKLGASRFLKRGDADDGVGLELVVEPWLKSLWATLAQIAETFAIQSKVSSTMTANELSTTGIAEESIESVVQKVTAEQLGFDVSKLPPLPEARHTLKTVSSSPPDISATLSVHPAYDASTVHQASVVSVKRLTASNAEKVVWHIELKCNMTNKSTEPFVYRPGDAFGIFVQNTKEEVERFLTVTHNTGNQIVSLMSAEGKPLFTSTIKRIVQERIDLRALPSKILLRSLSEHCSDIAHQRDLLSLCSRSSRAAYTERISRPGLTVLDVLEKMAPSCAAPLSLFLDLLPPPGLRWYSATSSPILDGTDVLHFAFSVVKKGLATTALAHRCELHDAGEPTEPVLLLPRESDALSYFRPPPLSSSYIMIGPGTGVAPFRGFLRERRILLRESDVADSSGKTMLFFGCRREEEDYLYQDDLEDLVRDGVLSVLDVAFSRKSENKIYVQDRLIARKHEVAEIVRQGGAVFVCGDGGGMAVGVHHALTNILTELLCNGVEEDGSKLMKDLSEKHKYVRDIWFHG